MIALLISYATVGTVFASIATQKTIAHGGLENPMFQEPTFRVAGAYMLVVFYLGLLATWPLGALVMIHYRASIW